MKHRGSGGAHAKIFLFGSIVLYVSRMPYEKRIRYLFEFF
jgi:hypothetical protein